MSPNPLLWIGLGGIRPDDNARARHWQQRLHWVMVVIALFAVPTYLLDTAESHPSWHTIANVLDAVILIAFLAETLWMLHVSSFPKRYLVENWLNLVVLLGSLAALLGASTGWVAVIRVLRAGIGGLFLLKIGAEFEILFTRRGAPLLTGMAVGTTLLAGATLWWLEPSVHTFWEGVWLAIVTATTVGYGDFYATTGPSRVVAVFVMLLGWALLSLFTANIVARFVGRDETAIRNRMYHDIEFVRRHLDTLATEARAERSDDSALLAEIRALREDVARIAARLDAIERRGRAEPDETG